MSTSSTPIFPTATTEPAHGSIVLLEGETGTAYQRLFSTDLWHSTTGGLAKPLSWAQLVERTSRPGACPILLVHDVPVEVEGQQELPLDLAGATLAQRREIADLVARTGAPVVLDGPRTRAEAAGLLITLRAYAAERSQ